MSLTPSRRVLAIWSLLSLCTFAQTALGVTFDDGRMHRLDSVEAYLWIQDSLDGVPTTVDIPLGGEVQNGARIYGSGIVNVLDGGYVNWLHTFDRSVANINGGYVAEVAAGGSSEVNVAGGTIGSLEIASSRATVNIFGTGLAISGESGTRVTGTLWDGSTIDADVVSSAHRIVLNPALDNWQNPVLPLDVDHDAVIAPIDSLLIVNEMNSGGSRPLSAAPLETPAAFFDVNGDGHLTPLDSLLIINELNARAMLSGDSPQPLAVGRQVMSVPEPGCSVLLATGALGALFLRRTWFRSGRR